MVFWLARVWARLSKFAMSEFPANFSSSCLGSRRTQLTPEAREMDFLTPPPLTNAHPSAAYLGMLGEQVASQHSTPTPENNDGWGEWG